MPLTGALLDVSALQDTVSAAGEFPQPYCLRLLPGLTLQGTQLPCWGCEGEPRPAGGWSQGVLRASPIFPRVWRFPMPQLDPRGDQPAAEGRSACPSPALPAAGLPTAAPRSCQVGCPSTWPREHEAPVFRKIFQGMRQAFKTLAVCCSVGCPVCERAGE